MDIDELIENLTKTIEQGKLLDNHFEYEDSDKPIYPKLFFFNE